MKKIMILTFVAATAVSSLSHAATDGTVCNAATTAGAGAEITADATTSTFVKVSFTPKCSANVHMGYSQTGTSFGVVSGSSKGKFAFGGGTGGGGVKSTATCATSGCTSTNTTAALALTQANAS
jgi:hypothetical protein